MDTGRSASFKTARYTSVQQAHLCRLGSGLHALDNSIKYKYEIQKEKQRHEKTLENGRAAIARAYAWLHAYEACLDEEEDVIIEEFVNEATGKPTFTRQNTGKSCRHHDDLHRKWKIRGTPEIIKKFKKTREGECACVIFYKEEDGIEVVDNTYDSLWCKFQDESTAGQTVPMTDDEVRAEALTELEGTEFELEEDVEEDDNNNNDERTEEPEEGENNDNE